MGGSQAARYPDKSFLSWADGPCVKPNCQDEAEEGPGEGRADSLWPCSETHLGVLKIGMDTQHGSFPSVFL